MLFKNSSTKLKEFRNQANKFFKHINVQYETTGSYNFCTKKIMNHELFFAEKEFIFNRNFYGNFMEQQLMHAK